MPEAVSVTVPPESDQKRADKALADALADWSRERLKGLFDEGAVQLNGVVASRRTKVSEGDVLSVLLPPIPDTTVLPMPYPLEVLYEDEDIIAIDKPSGIVTHPGAAVVPPTLCHALLHHTNGQLARAGGEERPGVVHRLDKQTTGVIVFAKNDEAYYSLVSSFSERKTKKEYWAIVSGSPALEAGSIREPIERDPHFRTRMKVREDGRPAHTDWKVVERLGVRSTLMHCRIHTGRTHQIRVHMSHLGHPLLGDSTYGYRARSGDTPITDVFLHAVSLELPHPTTGHSIRFTSRIPRAFEQMLIKLRG
ncbi:MAG: RluA family pseudouridine synthase [Verrucomicrobiota bacterium]